MDSNASPFVIAAKDAGLIGFDSFMNVVILISVLSIGNSAVYAGSRTLTAIAEKGYAPRIFAYVDRAGRPLMSTCLIIVFGALAYVNVTASGVEIFDWLLALSGLTALFTWGSVSYTLNFAVFFVSHLTGTPRFASPIFGSVLHGLTKDTHLTRYPLKHSLAFGARH